MENQNPLEMQNPNLNPQQPPHLSPRAHCVFCGADLNYSAQQCLSCGAQAEHAPEPQKPVYDDSVHTSPYEEPAKQPKSSERAREIKNRLEPDHNKPVDKRKLIYSIIIIVLALIVIGLLQSQGA